MYVFNYYPILIVYNEKTGLIDVKIKKNNDANGRERVKTSRYNKECVDFLRQLDGTYETKTKLWHFKPEQKDALNA